LAVSGAATMVMEAVHITVLQRLLPGELLGRVFGIMDTLIYSGILAGSLLSTVLDRAFGLRIALVTVSGLIVVIAAISLRRLRVIEGRPRGGDGESVREVAANE
jgi:MFS family permease